MKTITITLTDAEATLLDSQATAHAGSPMGMGVQVASFEEELNVWRSQRLASARDLARRKITEPLTDEQLAQGAI